MQQDFLHNVEILVLDFGSQYTQLIARRLREYGVYTEIVPYFEKIDSIKAKNPKGIILSGGPASVYAEGAYKPDSAVFDLGVPVLGICYGMQYIAHFFGGSVVRAEAQEFGKAVLEILNLEESLTFSEFNHKSMPQALEALVSLWEDSVRDSHDFLRENDIVALKPEVSELLKTSENTLVATDDETFLGFLGVEHNRIEMLFVHPKFFKRGVGIALLREVFVRSLRQYDNIVVDCNAGNTRGLRFYQQLGFREIGVSQKDSKGRDFPIVHLEVSSKELESNLQSHNILFHNVKQDSIVWMSHADKVESVPSGFVELAKSGNTHYCAIADFKRQVYALQFHPEVVHSECGGEILKNFAVGICGVDTSWNMRNFAEAEIVKLREKVLGLDICFINKNEAFNQMGAKKSIEILTQIWECGAKVTHNDLTQKEIASMKLEIEKSIIASEQLCIAQKNGEWLGFVAVENDEITLLFVASKYFKKGLGKALIREALDRYLMDFESVKVGSIEWALEFYTHLGFTKNDSNISSKLYPDLIPLRAGCMDLRHILTLQKAEFSKVLCAVSGGVDSSVVATLLYRAIGENLIPVFVDTGLLRKGEREAVEAMFRENLKVPLIVADARELFLGRLKGVTDPEKKRKIIGETFIEVFEAEAKKHNTKGEIKFLAQGTLYPDVIESVSVKGPSKTIKSHHNVGGLPEWMKFELIEPLRELFKDEVRALGRELGMPESMLMRHPFPGPGLAIRIMGEVNAADLEILKEADSIFIEELHKWGLYDSVWQAFCVLLNVRSVGVMGDNRTYDNTICVRAVEAMDGMTASFSHLPHAFLESVSNRIINEVAGINRVVYDITSKPPGTIEWE
ncbi:glutamine-hydrolyzing GMP synthase [Helicobacter winghamensis]|uniref:glutamine-hydrolyzing GMP synthase n=1 Tax=Helicobacter winghamensis TaxID=157268 RepID=UPI00351BCDFB